MARADERNRMWQKDTPGCGSGPEEDGGAPKSPAEADVPKSIVAVTTDTVLFVGDEGSQAA